jgi:hypothetical protein
VTSSTPARRRPLLGGIAMAASAAVVASALPLLTASAAAAAVLPTPTIVGPTDSSQDLKEVVLDWTAVPGAKAYRVQVGTDDEWSDTPTYTTETVASRFTLPAWLPHASYVWRVAALGQEAQSRWATGGTFTRGWLTAPDGLSVTKSGWLPSFSWNPIATASEYQLQVSTSPYFNDPGPGITQADPITEACFTTRTTVTPFNSQVVARNDGAGDCNFTLLGSSETLHWRVRGLDHVVDGSEEVDTTPVSDEGISHAPPAKSGELDVTTCPAPPKSGADSSAAPVAGSAPNTSPSPVASAAPSASPAAGEEPKSEPCEPAHTVEKGAWSQGQAFTSAYIIPEPDDTRRYASLGPITAKPVTDDPLCDTNALCRDFPTLRWDAVAGADWYRVYVALDKGFTNIHEIAETPGTSWTPTAQWRESTAVQSYHYVIQPCTTSGTAPGCGQVPDQPSVFRKSSPKLSTTGIGAAGPVGAEVVLSWQSHADAMRAAGVPASSEAYAYRVQVTTASDPDFVGALIDEAEVDATHHVSPSKVYPDGELIWRVQAIDASGHKLPWSAPRTFVHDSTAPTFTVTPAMNLAINGAVKVTFSEPVKGISGSSVTMAGTTASVVASADGISATVTPDKNLMPGATYPVSVSGAVADLAGNAVAPKPVGVVVAPLVDDRSRAMGFGGSWTRLTSSNAVNGTFSRSVPTPTRQTAATVALFGRGAEVKGCVGPANGVIELWADGIRLTRIDTYRSYSSCGVVLTRAPFKSGNGAHRIQVRGVGVKNVKSKGTAIGIDAITAVR